MIERLFSIKMIAPSEPDTKGSSDRNTKLIIVALTILVIFITNTLIIPSKFADYYAYLLLTDSLHYYPGITIFGFEFLSNVIFLSLRWITGSTSDAIDLAHQLLGMSFITLLYVLSRRDDVKWRGLLVFVGAFGSLLAFVTIRATPAYFFVTIAMLEANRGRIRSLVWAGLALMFHVSAFLAVPPLMAGLAYNRFGMMTWIQRATAPILAGGVIYMVLFVLFKGFVFSVLQTVLYAVPFLNKYIVYTGSDPSGATNIVDQASAGSHMAYAIIVSIFALSCFVVKSDKLVESRPYILASYVIFQLLEISPITAYRQSFFWLMPIILIFPWERIARGPLFTTGLVLLSVALFTYSATTVFA